jgi:hypothetical protein
MRQLDAQMDAMQHTHQNQVGPYIPPTPFSRCFCGLPQPLLTAHFYFDGYNGPLLNNWPLFQFTFVSMWFQGAYN